MHDYLRAIGFEQMTNAKFDAVLNQVVENPNYMNMAAMDSQGNDFVEFSKDFGDSMGISICGSYLDNGEFAMDYYYPYFHGKGVTSEEPIDVEKYAEKEAYAGICDEIRVGVTLIFYLQNVADYLKEKLRRGRDFHANFTTTLSGLSLEGTVILPISKSEKQIRQNEKMTRDRHHLIAAAREGDEEAIESLTLEDIDTYSMISRRIVKEDVLSIVDSYFMPYGIESDHYSVLGEILNYSYTVNKITGQRVCVMTLNTNNLIYDVCINEKDLFGVPQIGRRFKGIVWLQGTVKISN